MLYVLQQIIYFIASSKYRHPVVYANGNSVHFTAKRFQYGLRGLYYAARQLN